MSDATIVVVETEDQDLQFAQGVRKKLVGDLTKTGMPQDKESRMILLQALDGMDRSALGRKRIKVEEDAGKNQAQFSGVIADLLRQQNPNAAVIASQASGAVSRPAPVLGSEVPDPILVEGETSTANSQLTYDSFISKMQPEGSTE